MGRCLGCTLSLLLTIGHEDDHEDQSVVMGWGGVGRAPLNVSPHLSFAGLCGALDSDELAEYARLVDHRDGPKAGLISGWVQCVCVCIGRVRVDHDPGPQGS